MRDIYTGGILWLDEEMKHRYDGKAFVDAAPEQQTAHARPDRVAQECSRRS